MNGRSSAHPFIALEGCDGVGKSTIRDELTRVIERLGHKCTIVGQHSWLDVRASRIINSVRDQTATFAPEHVAKAYFVDKRLHAEHTIGPATEDAVVIADRFILSDAVYQEVLYGIPAETTLSRHRNAGTREPDLTIFVTVPVEVAYERVRTRSKKSRHYERPAEMTKIMAAYDRLINGSDVVMRTPVVEFVNQDPNWVERVDTELAPVLRDLISRSSHRTSMSAGVESGGDSSAG